MNNNESDFEVIENNEVSKDEYGHRYGSATFKITKEDLSALYKRKMSCLWN